MLASKLLTSVKTIASCKDTGVAEAISRSCCIPPPRFENDLAIRKILAGESPRQESQTPRLATLRVDEEETAWIPEPRRKNNLADRPIQNEPDRFRFERIAVLQGIPFVPFTPVRSCRIAGRGPAHVLEHPLV